jgi:hypothetical protein
MVRYQRNARVTVTFVHPLPSVHKRKNYNLQLQERQITIVAGRNLNLRDMAVTAVFWMYHWAYNVAPPSFEGP